MRRAQLLGRRVSRRPQERIGFRERVARVIIGLGDAEIEDFDEVRLRPALSVKNKLLGLRSR